MGMVNLGSLALAGTKLKANASDRKTLRARDLDKELLRIDKEIEEILRESEEIDAEEDRLLGVTSLSSGYALDLRAQVPLDTYACCI
ncbi:hypothetical protein HKBW3S42_02350 [Candidatus Hakubella thermalkaliphila]|uniref:Uncharacterized protein n=1 Tax=Candidatus Hakubella thermalkaliphila TaxID=2754717 RepID=A0A6V8PPM8_9ACTN|nr:hypothetical protein HKBW3S42_02350 [Candidatus Hakubella thermalkaliphila]